MNSPRVPSSQSDTAIPAASSDVFVALRGLLFAYKADLAVVHDKDDHFYANCKNTDAKGKAQFFGAVKVSGRRHTFHFMPIYDFPDLLDAISPTLKKRMRGKSCFNIDSRDPVLIQALEHLVEQGVSRYRDAGKL